MALHPQIQQALHALAEAKLPALESLSPVDARAQMDAMVKARGGSPAPVAKTESWVAAGLNRDVPVRVYWPLGSGRRPAVVYFHGGGHVIGSLDTHDVIARNLCAFSETVVVSVDYRMAPEHKFPAAVEDAFAAVRWLHGAADRLGADPDRLALAGDSAGANLAAVTALLVRDAGAPDLKLQVLVYPVVDYELVGESYHRYAEGYGVLTKAAMQWFRQHYLNHPGEAADWRASPIKARSLAGVAPAVVITAECDVLRDDGARYARALRQAGVSVDYREYEGMIHGFFGMSPSVDHAREAQRYVAAHLKRAFA